MRVPRRPSAVLLLAAWLVAAWPADASAAADVLPPSVQTASMKAAEIDAAVIEAARRFDFPESWIHAVMQVESRRNPRAVSPKGAMGLMQLMPPTWRDYQQILELGNDPFDVRDNVMAGSAFLRDLRDRFGPLGMLAAYNAGPGRYVTSLSSGRPLPAETRAYVALLADRLHLANPGFASHTDRGPVRALAAAPLFVARPSVGPTQIAAADPVTPTAPEDTLFARRGEGGEP